MRFHDYKYSLVFLFPCLALAGEANLSWVAPTQDTSGNPLVGANALTEYRLYERCGSAGYGSPVSVSAASLSASRTSLPDGETCFWQLSAVTQFGESIRSKEASKSFPLPAVPGAPANLVITWEPSQTRMAFVESQFTQNTTGTTRSVTTAASVVVGQLIAAYAPSESNGINVTFSNSGTATLDTWTEIAGLNQSDAVDGYEQEVAYTRVTGAGTLTVTATWGSAPAWGGLAVSVYSEMPNPLVLQDSQYDAVTATNPVGTLMTPTSQPAWVIGWGLRWGSPLQTPGADTGAGFTDGGSGCTYAGTAIVRHEYQRITATTDLDMEFTTTNSGKFYLNGLIFTEAAAGGAAASFMLNHMMQQH